MLLEVPKVYLGIGYYEGISLILWCLSIIVLMISFVLFVMKSFKVEMKSQKMLYLGYSVFGLCFGLSRVFFIIAFFNPDYFDFFTIIAYIAGITGIIFWLFVLENYIVKKTKKIMFYISLGLFILALIALVGVTSRYFALTLLYALMPILIISVLLLYLYLIIITTGTIRIKATWLLFSLSLACIGYAMDTEIFLEYFSYIPLFISPLIMNVGIILFIVTQWRD